MDYIRRQLARVRSVLVSMPPSQRYSVIALLGVVAVSLVMLIAWGGREQYAPVISDLTGQQMTAIQSALKDSVIRYKLGDATLYVAPSDRDRVWMALSEKGALPSDVSKSFGFEDLVKPKGFNMETAEELAMKRDIALGNELAQKVASAPEIARAQVYIASARDGFFGKEQATAAVYIQPKTSEPLAKGKLRAICQLVAAAVGPKLSPKAVVVSNLVTGEAFSLEDEDSAFTRASDRVALQRDCNKYYAREVQEFLAPFFGSVKTLVDTRVDANTRSSRKTLYDTIEEKSSSTTTSSGGAAPGGETLVQPNVAASVVAEGASSAMSKSETEEKEKKKAPTEETVEETPPGEVKNVSISVIADLERVRSVIRTKDGLKETEDVPQARLTQEYEFWKQTLLNALPREDATTNIASVSFSAAPIAKIEFASAAPVSLQVRTGVSGIVAAVLSNWHRIALAFFALFALFMIRGLARKTQAEVEVVEAQKAQTREEEEVQLPEVEIDMDQKRAAKMRESIEDMIRSDPQTAVSLIRRWMARES